MTNLLAYHCPFLWQEHCPQGSHSQTSSKFLLRPSKSSSCRPVHLWPGVNFSSQLKHSPWALLLCISSQVSLFIGVVGLNFVDEEKSTTIRLKGLVVSLWRISCLSLIWDRLIASFNNFGLNILMSSANSDLSPPMNVPAKAFCVQPCTRFSNRSNSFW